MGRVRAGRGDLCKAAAARALLADCSGHRGRAACARRRAPCRRLQRLAQQRPLPPVPYL